MLDKYNISTTLVCVIQKGVNDSEIPALIEYATGWKCVRGIVFQVREKIIQAESNPFSADDMIPLPCDPHKICVGYALKSKGNIYPVT